MALRSWVIRPLDLSGLPSGYLASILKVPARPTMAAVAPVNLSEFWKAGRKQEVEAGHFPHLCPFLKKSHKSFPITSIYIA